MYNHVISVAATDKDNIIGSNRFPSLDLCAPGSGNYSTASNKRNGVWSTNEYRFVSGEAIPSAAVPVVAALCSMLLSINPCLTPDDVDTILKRTCQNISAVNAWANITNIGSGLIDAYAACQLALNYGTGISGQDYSITNGQNITWDVNDDKRIANEIHIYSGGKLTIKSTVRFLMDAKIIVESGGKLVVNGGYLTNSDCEEMWGGIVVLGDNSLSQVNLINPNQGYVWLQNAIIEHATVGVSVGNKDDYLEDGGILRAQNSIFKNCKTSVIFYPYSSPSMPTFNFSSVYECKFIASESYLYQEPHATVVFVKLEHVHGIGFYGNTFTNLTPGTDLHTIGIQSEGSSYNVQRNYTDRDIITIPCIPSGNKNKFEGLAIGIDINSDVNQIVKVLDNEFNNTTIGIQTRNDVNTIIYKNTFNYTNGFIKDYSTSSPIAIYLNRTGNITIDENRFIWDIPTYSGDLFLGIHSVYPYTHCKIKNNRFEKTLASKVFVNGNYISGTHPDYKMWCNDYINTTYDWVLTNSGGLCDQYYPNSSNQPYLSAGNNFNNSGIPCNPPENNIYNIAGSFTYYTTHTTPPKKPTCYTPNKVIFDNSLTELVCSNIITTPCNYYENCFTMSVPNDPGVPPDISGTFDHTVVEIINEIRNGDSTSATDMILELDTVTQSNLIKFLNICNAVFYDDRNFWQLNETETNELYLLATSNDEAGIYAQNILAFYQDSIFPIDTLIMLKGFKTITNVSCYGGNNGSVNLGVFGGMPPYTYSWSNNADTQSISGLSAGIYILTVTDSVGNNLIDTTTITQPSALTFSATIGSSVNCFGDSLVAVFAPIGGTSPYYYRVNDSYNLTSNINYFHAGNYAVTLYDTNGCFFINNFNITGPSVISISHNITDESCEGSSDGAIELTVNGGVAPYSYLWSDNETAKDLINLSAGIYQVTVTDQSNCSKIDNATVNADPIYVEIVTGVNPNDLIAHVNNEFDEDYYYSYLWNTNDTTNAIYGVISSFTYDVTVTKRNNSECFSTDEIFVPGQERGIMGFEDHSNDFSLKIYPNPVKEELTLNLSNNSANTETFTIVINNIFGNVIFTEKFTLNKADKMIKNLNLEYLSTGSYILLFYKNDNLIIRKKIIKI